MDDHEYWLQLAQPLGKNLIVIGHSLGGLLSFRAALLNPESIRAAVLISPALELNFSLHQKILFGTFFNLDLNQFSKNIEPFYRTEKPARAGSYVEQLIDLTFSLNLSAKKIDRVETYGHYSVPSLIISTENDDVVNDKQIKVFFGAISTVL